MKEENKLKTLKDLYLIKEKRILRIGHVYIDGDELKQEAIKWMKFKEKEIEELEGKGYGGQYTNIMIEFFNLTDEDLQ